MKRDGRKAKNRLIRISYRFLIGETKKKIYYTQKDLNIDRKTKL